MMQTMTLPPVAVAGLGNMGQAIARGIAVAGTHPPLLLHSRRSQAAAALAVELGGQAVEVDRLAEAATIFCCSEPDDVVDLLARLAPMVGREHVLVVIAPSAPTAELAALTGAQVARVIPNLATRAAMGTLVVDDSGLDAEAQCLLEAVIAPLGGRERVDETTIRTASGLASSGPAVVAAFLESWLPACGAGLSQPARLRLAGRTLEGVAALLAQGWDLDQIIRGVALPGGPTSRLVAAVAGSLVEDRLTVAVAANEGAAQPARDRWLAALARGAGGRTDSGAG